MESIHIVGGLKTEPSEIEYLLPANGTSVEINVGDIYPDSDENEEEMSVELEVKNSGSGQSISNMEGVVIADACEDEMETLQMFNYVGCTNEDKTKENNLKELETYIFNYTRNEDLFRREIVESEMAQENGQLNDESRIESTSENDVDNEIKSDRQQNKIRNGATTTVQNNDKISKQEIYLDEAVFKDESPEWFGNNIPKKYCKLEIIESTLGNDVSNETNSDSEENDHSVDTTIMNHSTTTVYNNEKRSNKYLAEVVFNDKSPECINILKKSGSLKLESSSDDDVNNEINSDSEQNDRSVDTIMIHSTTTVQSSEKRNNKYINLAEAVFKDDLSWKEYREKSGWYICKHCHHKDTLQNIKKHIIATHRKTETKQCPFCNVKTNVLTYHIRMYHKNMRWSPECNDTPSSNMKIIEPTSENDVNNEINSDSEQNDHSIDTVMIHFASTGQITLAEAVFKDDFSCREYTESKGRYICKHCRHKDTLQNIKNHIIATHRKTETKQCPFCDVKTNVLTYHIRMYHKKMHWSPESINIPKKSCNLKNVESSSDNDVNNEISSDSEQNDHSIDTIMNHSASTVQNNEKISNGQINLAEAVFKDDFSYREYTESGGRYICKHCRHKDTLPNIKNHIIATHRKTETKQCPFCNVKTNVLTYHIRMYHKNKHRSPKCNDTPKKSSNLKIVESTSENDVNNEINSDSEQNDHSIDTIMNHSTTTVLNDDKRSYRQIYLAEAVFKDDLSCKEYTESGGRYICKHCRHKDTLQNIKNHIISTHRKTETKQCPSCNVKTKVLAYHIRLYHKDMDRSPECNDIPKKYCELEIIESTSGNDVPNEVNSDSEENDHAIDTTIMNHPTTTAHKNKKRSNKHLAEAVFKDKSAKCINIPKKSCNLKNVESSSDNDVNNEINSDSEQNDHSVDTIMNNSTTTVQNNKKRSSKYINLAEAVFKDNLSSNEYRDAKGGYICKHCRHKEDTLQNIKNHIIATHRKTETKQCPFCNVETNVLTYHIRMFHKNKHRSLEWKKIAQNSSELEIIQSTSGNDVNNEINNDSEQNDHSVDTIVNHSTTTVHNNEKRSNKQVYLAEAVFKDKFPECIESSSDDDVNNELNSDSEQNDHSIDTIMNHSTSNVQTNDKISEEQSYLAEAVFKDDLSSNEYRDSHGLYICKHCRHKDTLQNIKKHIIATHRKTETKQCPFCNVKTNVLTYHIRMFHNKHRSLKCKKIAQNSSELKIIQSTSGNDVNNEINNDGEQNDHSVDTTIVNHSTTTAHNNEKRSNKNLAEAVFKDKSPECIESSSDDDVNNEISSDSEQNDHSIDTIMNHSTSNVQNNDKMSDEQSYLAEAVFKDDFSSNEYRHSHGLYVCKHCRHKDTLQNIKEHIIATHRKTETKQCPFCDVKTNVLTYHIRMYHKKMHWSPECNDTPKKSCNLKIIESTSDNDVNNDNEINSDSEQNDHSIDTIMNHSTTTVLNNDKISHQQIYLAEAVFKDDLSYKEYKQSRGRCKCLHCGHEDTLQNIKDHIIEKHKKSEMKQCPSCNVTSKVLAYHIRLYHKDMHRSPECSESTSDNDVNNEINSDSEQNDHSVDTIMDNSTTTVQNNKKNSSTYINLAEAVFKDDFSSKEYTESRGRYICKHCRHKDTLQNIKKHIIATHRKTETKQCPSCNVKTNVLAYHIRMYHKDMHRSSESNDTPKKSSNSKIIESTSDNDINNEINSDSEQSDHSVDTIMKHSTSTVQNNEKISNEQIYLAEAVFKDDFSCREYTESRGRYTCKHCRHKDTLQNIKKHIIATHRKTETKQCPSCNVKTKVLAYHIRMYHKDMHRSSESNDTPKESSNSKIIESTSDNDVNNEVNSDSEQSDHSVDTIMKHSTSTVQNNDKRSNEQIYLAEAVFKDDFSWNEYRYSHGLYVCKHCRHKDTLQNIKNHIIAKHRKTETKQCPFCDVKTNVLAYHIRMYHKNKHRSSECNDLNNEINSDGEQNDHTIDTIMNHPTTTIQNNDKRSNQQIYLAEAVFKDESPECIELTSDNDVNNEINSGSEQNDHSVDTIMNKSTTSVHNNKKRSRHFNLAEAVFKDDISSKEYRDSKGGYMCKHCRHEDTLEKIKKHIIEKHKKSEMKLCQFCNVKTKVLAYHMRMYHKNIHKCPECNHIAKTLYKLKVHINEMHRVNLSTCDKCDKISPKDLKKRKVWTEKMTIESWSPTKNDRLCSNHFEQHWCYQSNTEGRVRLLSEAIPTVFPQLPEYVQPKKTRKRSYATSQEQPSTSTVSNPDSPRKKKLKMELFKEVRKNRAKTNKTRILHSQSLRSYKKKVVSLKHILSNLQANSLLDMEKVKLLENITHVNKEMLERNLNKKGEYSPELRKFAITLNFFSPKAYNYVRYKFVTCLPHSSTIGEWFQSIDAAPGFSTEAFETLSKKIKFDNKPCICALVFNEMSIRKHLEWDGKKSYGYVNFGVDFQDDSNELAREAFVLMVVSLNGSWKLPVGYFLSNGINGQQKYSIIEKCIVLLQDIRVIIVSITCDGASSNVTMGNLLGCSFEFPNFKTNFTINRDQKGYFFFDPSHMIKLVRNAFGENKVFRAWDGNLIEWRYIECLEKLQETKGLHLANELRKAHVQFFNQKIKVRLAVQLFSKSVADSLEYCENTLGLEEFKGSKGTVHFLRMMNDIFDVLNSRSLIAPGYKQAMCQKNIERNIEFINFASDYISKLSFLNGELIINSQRKMGFVGILTSLNSALELYRDIVVKQNLLTYIPIYKISQDHLELFFSSVRSKGGWNNNPTARQFMGVYKRLMVRGEVGNCIPLDQIPVLVASSRTNYASPEEAINFTSPGISEQGLELEDESLFSIIDDHDFVFSDISDYSSQAITYIAGFISDHLQKKLKCQTCVASLIGHQGNFLFSLIYQKTYGGLTYPSEDVVKICNKAEYFLKIHKHYLHKKNFVQTLINIIMRNSLDSNTFRNLENHVLENPVNHIYFLIKCVCTKYLNVRLHFIAKMQSQQLTVRRKLTKLILFKGQ